MVLAPGNEHELKHAREVLPENISGCFVLADKGFDADEFRQYLRDQEASPQIPPRSNRKIKPAYNKEVGKYRHLVENFFPRLKSFRRLNTRYDKLPETFLGFLTLAAIKDWLDLQFVRLA
jgi:transposase